MLHSIVEEKKREIKALKERHSLEQWLDMAEAAPVARPFVKRLLESPRPVSVIAEVKKASPSKGLIRADFDPLAIAGAYEQASVEAISVLTDEKFFQGSKGFLSAIRERTSTPLLRKDFLLDPVQVAEARVLGADCILLIAAILEPEQLTELAGLAKRLGMDVLIEVHDRKELEMVLSCTAPSIVGINNRNLKTFETTLETTRELLPFVPAGVPVVSESGIHSRGDIDHLHRLGVRAVLVGEHFMRQNDIASAVEELVGR